MKPELKYAACQFDIPGRLAEARAYGTGHINDTYLATFEREGGADNFIIQRINHDVFRRPEEMTDNIVRITRHLRGQLKERYPHDLHRRVLEVIGARDGKAYYRDDAGNYWRAFHFIKGARTYDVLQSLEQAYEAARQFGLFQKLLSDLPQPPLFESIPDFHHGPKRYRTFEEAVKQDCCNRAAGARREIAFVQEQADTFEKVPRLVQSGALPVRNTHNDTKINNVMLDDLTGEGLCVLDLDTTMPGVSIYDFGDIVRTTVSSAVEDEADLSKITVEISRFDAIARGFLAGAGGGLNRCEIDHLVFGGRLLTLIIATRFLTDYLAGDRYYKIHHEGHNLQRCRAQLQLVQSIMDHEEAMNTRVDRLCRNRFAAPDCDCYNRPIVIP